MSRIILLLLLRIVFSTDLPDTLNPCDSLKDPYSQARCLDAHQRTDDALFVMQSAIRKDSSFQKSFFYLRLLTQCHDKITLKKFVPIFVSRFLDSGEVAVECAKGYAAAGDWKKGVLLLEREYDRKRRFNYLTEMLSLYVQFKSYESAQSIIEKIIATDSTYAEAYYLRGKLVFKRSLIQRIKDRKSKEELAREALVHFSMAVRFDSTNYGYFTEIGDLYDTLKLWDSTAIFYRKAVALAPGNFDLLFKFGNKLYDKHEYAECLEILERAFVVNTVNVDLILKIEAAHKRFGDYAEYYLTGQERLADAMPDTLSIRYNLALNYVERNMPDKAEAAFKKVLEKNDAFEEANKGLAALYLKQERFADALPYLNKQTTSAAGSDRDQYNLAQTYLLSGDTLAGVSAYEKVLLLNPKNAVAAFFLGTYYYNGKNYEECVRVLKEGLAYSDQAGASRMIGGALFYLKREPERALRLLKACVGTREEDEMLHYMLAALCETLRRPAEAVSEYQICLKMAPDGQNAEYYKSRIKLLEK